MKKLLNPGDRVRFTREEDRNRYGETGTIVDEFKTPASLMYGIRPDAEPNTVADTPWTKVEPTAAVTCRDCRKVYPLRPLYCECGQSFYPPAAVIPTDKAERGIYSSLKSEIDGRPEPVSGRLWITWDRSHGPDKTVRMLATRNEDGSWNYLRLATSEDSAAMVRGEISYDGTTDPVNEAWARLAQNGG